MKKTAPPKLPLESDDPDSDIEDDEVEDMAEGDLPEEEAPEPEKTSARKSDKKSLKKPERGTEKKSPKEKIKSKRGANRAKSDGEERSYKGWRHGWFYWFARIALYVALIPIVLTVIYAAVQPPVSNVMLLRAAAGFGINKKWVPLDQISPHLARAVITSEDARFCEHHGVDWVEVQAVVEDVFDDDEGAVRGASTISMQTAKNLFLWDGRSIVRKVLEVPLALWMDLVWTKKRMIEIYLNIVEWAPGIYGAEAAAQHHFKKSASKLTKREAALLAAVLPNPIKRKAGKPSRRVRSVADRIQQRLVEMDPYLTCVP